MRSDSRNRPLIPTLSPQVGRGSERPCVPDRAVVLVRNRQRGERKRRIALPDQPWLDEVVIEGSPRLDGLLESDLHLVGAAVDHARGMTDELLAPRVRERAQGALDMQRAAAP